MLPLIPVATVAGTLELAVVKWVIEDTVDATEREGFVASSFEVQIMLEPVVDFPATPFLVGELFEHLFNDWRANRIDNDLALFVHQPLIQITEWCHSWPQAHFDPCTQSTLHVFSTMIVFELRC